MRIPSSENPLSSWAEEYRRAKPGPMRRGIREIASQYAFSLPAHTKKILTDSIESEEHPVAKLLGWRKVSELKEWSSLERPKRAAQSNPDTFTEGVYTCLKAGGVLAGAVLAACALQGVKLLFAGTDLPEPMKG